MRRPLPEVAVIGMGCLFPGAGSPGELWSLLAAGRDMTSRATEPDFEVPPEFFYDSIPGKMDRVCYLKNGYIRDFEFHPEGYRMEPRKLRLLDSFFHWSLYAARQAIEDAGYSIGSEELGRCGVAMGAVGGITLSSRRLFTPLFLKMCEPDIREGIGDAHFSFGSWDRDSNRFAGYSTGMGARFVAQAVGARGPRHCFEAACASSLYAVRDAAHYLAAGRADLMLAGAACRSDNFTIACTFNALRVFPENGECLPFDRKSKGMKTGEGAGFFLLKRLDDAIRDGNRIHAVIESVGVSNDAGRSHILTPHGDGQLLAYQRAYRHLGKNVDYIECHGTGTPLGDQVELDTLERFHANERRMPMLGGNKWNVGHLLTAAGMVSLIKVIVSMNKGTLAPTMGLDEPITASQGILGPDRFVTRPTAWPEGHGPKRAGVNAFGFGGVNAHLVLREAAAAVRLRRGSRRPAKEPPVIVGIGAHFGALTRIDSLDDALRADKAAWAYPPFVTGSQERRPTLPLGSFVDEAEFDCVHLRMPPNEVNVSLFPQLLMTAVADRALKDAGFAPGRCPSSVAVLIGQELDYSAHRHAGRLDLRWQLSESLKRAGRSLSGVDFETLYQKLKDKISPETRVEGVAGVVANLVANRLSALWHFNGPSLSVFSQENSVFKALDLARYFLEVDEIEAVVVGGIDPAGGWERLLWNQEFHPLGSSGERFAFSRNANGWCPGEGAGAVVLTSQSFAAKHGMRAYSSLRSLVIQQDDSRGALEFIASPERVESVSAQALADAGVCAAEIGLLEAHAAGDEAQDSAEIDGLVRTYKKETATARCVIGSAKTVVGHLFAASGIASLIKVSLALHHRYRPPTQWNGPKDAARFATSDFFIPAETVDWERGRPRFAAVNSIGADGCYVHAIMGEGFPAAAELPTESPAEGLRRLPKVIKIGPTHIGEFGFRDLRLAPSMASRSSPPGVPAREALNARYAELAMAAQRNTMVAQSYYLAAFQGRMAGLTFPAKRKVIWDYPQILELCLGKVGDVLGAEYSYADALPVRMRPPSPPFLFVSRVTHLSFTPRELKPCTIEWEYDIPSEGGFAANGFPSTLIFSETSHAVLLALIANGHPMFLNSTTRFRVLDTVTGYCAQPPGIGQTFSAKSTVDSFIKNDRSILFRYTCECFHRGICFLRGESRGGVFYQEDLEQAGQRMHSMTWPAVERDSPATLLTRKSGKQSFTSREIEAFQRGDLGACFGVAASPARKYLLGSPQLLLLDRVTKIDLRGGRWRQGLIVGEGTVDPNHWVFGVHFPDDPLMPATLLVEACVQTALFFLYDLALLGAPEHFTFTMVRDLPVKAKFRAAVRPQPGRLQFRLHLRSIEATPEWQFRFDAEVLFQDRVIGQIEDLALRQMATE